MPSARMAAILRDLNRHRKVFDLTADGFGEKALDVMSDGLMRQLDAEKSPDGSPWPPLSEDYAADKARIAPGAPMAVLYGVLKTPENCAGERRIVPDEAITVFGTDETSRDEGRWFEEGDPGQNRPPRPWHGLSDITIQLLDDHAGKRFRDQI